MANELKPCICGKTPRIERKKGMAGITKVPFYREQIVCRCGVSSKLFKSPDQALTAWNTRPAAPVEGLETYMRANFGTDDLVTRSQAEAIIAAERAEIERLKDENSSIFETYLDRHNKIVSLEAENAALTARVGELEADIKTHVDGTTALVDEKVDAEFKAVDLETQLAAAKKALDFYGDVSKYPAPLTGGMGALWSDCGAIARAALEVKP